MSHTILKYDGFTHHTNRLSKYINSVFYNFVSLLRLVDLSVLLGKLTLGSGTAVFETSQLNITGNTTVWGRALRIGGTEGRAACSNIQVSNIAIRL